MRLKRVKIFGFKTFADRTEFDLHGNMIAVVGPNGCGKSNLVDAILWGLGEGNARHLRAQSGQDVIFSGSARRKGVGFAEVTLLFDNEDGALPVQTSEVSITRRLSRNGDSDYFINRQACRLRDVFDLLADSGLGRSGYSIVGQKEIDQALSASPDERRAWVDEAAGVQRYRVRKAESLKRLASAHDHLSRINDIVGELEGQREPLREEAEVAIRYKSVLASLREVESGLLIVEVAKATHEVLALEAKINDSIRLAQAESEIADKAEEQAQTVGQQLRELENQLDRVREQRQQSSTSSERAEAAIRLAEQKLQTLKDLEQNLGEEAEISRNRILEAEAELTGLEVELVEERDKLANLRDECAGAGEEAKTLKDRLQQVERELAQSREVHNRKLKQEAEQAHVAERMKSVFREIEGIEATLPDVRKAVSEAQAAYDEIAATTNGIEEQILAGTKDLQELGRRESDHATESRLRLAERATLEGRRQGIEATIEAHEGLNQGAKAVLDAVKAGKLSASYVPVGEALNVKKAHALALETALGGAVNDLIVQQERDAKDAIDYLKTNRLGRATFQPLPLMRPNDPNNDLKRLLMQPGIVGRACDLIESDKTYRPVFESLLGRVVIVDTIDTALRIAKTSGWNRLVTLEGEVVHSSGAVSGGVSAKSSYGLVQRKADLSQVITDITKLDKFILTAESKAKEFAAERIAFEEQIQTQRGSLKDKQAEVKESRDWLHNVQNELNATERSQAKLQHEIETLKGHKAEELPAVDLQAIEKVRDEVLSALASRNADAESAAERLREFQTRVAQAEIRFETGQKRLFGAKENEKLRERKISNLKPETDRTLGELEQSRGDLTASLARKAKADEELQTMQGGRARLMDEVQQCADSARKARSHAQTCTDSAHQAELARARIDTKRTASVQRLLEEYGISEEEAMVQEPLIQLPSDAAAVVNRLRRDLKAMGDVNVGAIEAYQRLTERWDELTNQREDVLGGILQVEASIRELDKLTREKFVTTFAAIEIAFADIFTRLFPGGEGRIFLTDPENILETGVDIDVMLPGKKRQRLELLSGGERSLCAASFLFSLLQVKPSPLVILDEVDAPLDGRNVERFISLLQDFMQTAQFILITHNPTTIESAPIWLGVTMQEPGVSTLVPARFAPVEAIVLN